MSDDEGTDVTAAGSEDISESGGQQAVSVGEALAERVSEHDEDLGAEVEEVIQKALELDEDVSELEATIEEQTEEIEDLKERLKHKQADFQNYKKRQDREKDRIRERATEDLVERLLTVRENLRRAVEEDHEDVDSIREGVKMTLREFDRVLDAENVVEISPDEGEEVDPQRHEVMMRVDSTRPKGTIADVYSPGYEMADKVLETAQITVSTGELPEDADADETSQESDDDDQPEKDHAEEPQETTADEEPTDTEGTATDDETTTPSQAADTEPDTSEDRTTDVGAKSGAKTEQQGSDVEDDDVAESVDSFDIEHPDEDDDDDEGEIAGEETNADSENATDETEDDEQSQQETRQEKRTAEDPPPNEETTEDPFADPFDDGAADDDE